MVEPEALMRPLAETLTEAEWDRAGEAYRSYCIRPAMRPLWPNMPPEYRADWVKHIQSLDAFLRRRRLCIARLPSPPPSAHQGLTEPADSGVKKE